MQNYHLASLHVAIEYVGACYNLHYYLQMEQFDWSEMTYYNTLVPLITIALFNLLPEQTDFYFPLSLKLYLYGTIYLLISAILVLLHLYFISYTSTTSFKPRLSYVYCCYDGYTLLLVYAYTICVLILATVGREILDSLIFHILNLCLDLIFVQYSMHAYSMV